MNAGLVLVDKPPGVTSAGVVREVKRLFQPLPVGHAGTLDPFATGLLICLVGRATRLARYAQFGQKTYTGTIQFGFSTDTDDSTGQMVHSSSKLPTLEECERAKSRFAGVQSQVPPKVSAIKVQGKRAYTLARQGKEVELAAREVEISSFVLREPLPNTTAVEKIAFSISCSKGTYIRSIARDLGNVVESPAHLSSLRREASLPFFVTDAVPLSHIGHNNLLPWDVLFPGAPRITVNANESRALSGGDQRVLPKILERQEGKHFGEIVVYCSEGAREPLGILVRDEIADWKLGVHVGKWSEATGGTLKENCHQDNFVGHCVDNL